MDLNCGTLRLLVTFQSESAEEGSDIIKCKLNYSAYSQILSKIGGTIRHQDSYITSIDQVELKIPVEHGTNNFDDDLRVMEDDNQSQQFSDISHQAASYDISRTVNDSSRKLLGRKKPPQYRGESRKNLLLMDDFSQSSQSQSQSSFLKNKI